MQIFVYIVIRPKTIVETDPVLRETETESDCLADRSAALDEQKAHLVRYNKRHKKKQENA